MWRFERISAWRVLARQWEAIGRPLDAARARAEADKLEAQLFDTRLEQA